MEGFPTSTHHDHEHQHHSSALPCCFISFSEPGFHHAHHYQHDLEAAAAAAAMAYDYESSCSSMPMLWQLQESRPPFEAPPPAAAHSTGAVAIQGSSATSLSSTQEMDGGGGKNRKHKRSNVGVKGLEEKKARGHGDVKAKEEEAGGEPPAGYIHVRARRGQATDSHSLAERLRRGKISERMKMLQSLVPGCDKVTGKALMLDEIISYVQSLQNQVEFLSMKLASQSPVMYEFGLGIDMYPSVPQVLKMAQVPHEVMQWQCMGQGNQQLPGGAEARGPMGFAQAGGIGMNMMQVGESQAHLGSMCFFQ